MILFAIFAIAIGEAIIICVVIQFITIDALIVAIAIKIIFNINTTHISVITIIDVNIFVFIISSSHFFTIKTFDVYPVQIKVTCSKVSKEILLSSQITSVMKLKHKKTHQTQFFYNFILNSIYLSYYCSF